MEKSLQKIILQRMSKTIRKAYKSNAEVSIVIMVPRNLKRWGNICRISIQKEKVLYNNLVDYAWNIDDEKANAEACNAISYFLYGEYKVEYSIV